MTGTELIVNTMKENKNETQSRARYLHDGRGKGKDRTGRQIQNNCRNCGRKRGRRLTSKKCHNCDKPNHFEKMVRNKNVSLVQEGSDSDSDGSHVIEAISKKHNKKISRAKVAVTKLLINNKSIL